jgi:hypothetical protein
VKALVVGGLKGADFGLVVHSKSLNGLKERRTRIFVRRRALIPEIS